MLIQSIKFLFISSIIVLVITSIHIKIMSIIKKIRSDLDEEREIISNYKKNIEIHNDINQTFIQTATAMYLKEIGDSKITQLFPYYVAKKIKREDYASDKEHLEAMQSEGWKLAYAYGYGTGWISDASEFSRKFW